MKAMEEEGDDGEYSDGYDGEALEAGGFTDLFSPCNLFSKNFIR